MFTQKKVTIWMAALMAGVISKTVISATADNLSNNSADKRCAVPVNLGAATNAFTNVANATNPVVMNQKLNTIIFIHRNNAAAFGGNSGILRYDISTDGGKTWTLNKGPLNPNSNGMGFLGRYPNAAIYNTPEDGWLAFLAPNTDGASWVGITNGLEKLDGSDNKDNFTPSPEVHLIQSMNKGGPGILWAIDSTGATGVVGANKIRLWKGVWNNNTSNFVWRVNKELAPKFQIVPANGATAIGDDLRIAFDPTGKFGWVSMLSHLTSGPANAAFYPVFYKTLDGGKTWLGPYEINIGTFKTVAAHVQPGQVASTAFNQALVVDGKGNPHLFVAVGNGDKKYGFYFASWHGMYDITHRSNGWHAIQVSPVKAGRGSWGVAPNMVSMDMQPMATRTADGSKVFFAWTDNSAYKLGDLNQTPNLFSKAYNVKTNLWTVVRDFTGCNSSINGKILYPKLAAQVYSVKNTTNNWYTYRMPVVYSVFTNNDPLQLANFNFLKNIIWQDSDFTKAN